MISIDHSYRLFSNFTTRRYTEYNDYENYKGETNLSRDDLIEMDGEVTEVLAGSLFRVQVENEDGSAGPNVLCYLGGKIRQNNIRIILHDLVRIAISPYSLDKGKIIFRYK
jgi:translation initiation factor IF-1